MATLWDNTLNMFALILHQNSNHIIKKNLHCSKFPKNGGSIFCNSSIKMQINCKNKTALKHTWGVVPYVWNCKHYKKVQLIRFFPVNNILLQCKINCTIHLWKVFHPDTPKYGSVSVKNRSEHCCQWMQVSVTSCIIIIGVSQQCWYSIFRFFQQWS